MGKRSKKGRDGEGKASKVSTSSQEAIGNLLHAIKAGIESLQPVSNLTVEDVLAWSERVKIAVPFTGIPRKSTTEREKINFSVDSPKNVAIVGSFLLGTMVGEANVDVAIEMPSTMLHEKCELNFQYLFKRAFLLAKVAEGLRGLPELEDASFKWVPFRGHALKPILSVTPKNLNVDIRIHVSIPVDAIKRQRLGPTRNSVRKSAFLHSEGCAAPCTQLDPDGLTNCPTPIYNSLVVSDMLMFEHLKLIHKECVRVPALKEAIKLGKAWLAQRGFKKYAFHLNGFQISMIFALLSHKGRVDATMPDLQIFKTFLAFLAESKWPEPVTFRPTAELDFPPINPQDFSLDAFRETFAASLVEGTAGMNILFDWTAEVAAEVKRAAQITLAKLPEGGFDLDSLFLRPEEKMCRFDVYFYVSDFCWALDPTANFKHYADQHNPEVARMKMIAKRLRFALSSRATQITVRVPMPGCSQAALQYDPQVVKVEVGVELDREEGLRLVDLGPTDHVCEEGKRFSQFWGDQAELRRFKDGSVRMALSWEALKNSPHLIVPRIVDFVFDHHFARSKVFSNTASLDFVSGINAPSVPVMSAFQKLSKNLRSLHGLPLSITRCECIGPTACYTSCIPQRALDGGFIPPNNGYLPEFTPVSKVLLYFEGSSRWPEEYYGVSYAKQAFAAQICKQLTEDYNLQSSVTLSFFDVFIEGYVFRCYIYYQDEAKLMQAHGLDPEEIVYHFEDLPRHTRQISVVANSNALFGPACRLFKRWVSAHMYSLQIPEELLELIAAKVFLSKDTPPGSVVAGFSRILNLFASYRWEDHPFFVSFDDDDVVPKEGWSFGSANEAFKKEQLPPLLWVTTSQQAGCSAWSKKCTLSKSDLFHLQQLARAALSLLNSRSSEGVELLFCSSLQRFDMVLHLDPAANNKKHLQLDARNEKTGKEDYNKYTAKIINTEAASCRFLRALPGFDPIDCLIKDLATPFPQARLYYDFYGGDRIGIVAKGFDTQALAQEIKNFSGDIVQSIEIQS